MPTTISKFPNRKSIRLQGFDYSQPGAYFVTIISKNRKRIFGKKSDGVIVLSPIGIIVKNELEKLPYRFKGLELDEIIIMPDHVHVVILLREKDGIFEEQAEKPKRPQKGSLGVIVRSFKSSVSVRVHQILKNDMDVWQRNYYEEYIEDDEKLDCIREYIQNNPFKESCGE